MFAELGSLVPSRVFAELGSLVPLRVYLDTQVLGAWRLFVVCICHYVVEFITTKVVYKYLLSHYIVVRTQTFGAWRLFA